MTPKTYQILAFFHTMIILCLVPFARSLESWFSSICTSLSLSPRLVLYSALIFSMLSIIGLLRKREFEVNYLHIFTASISLLICLLLIQTNAELIHIFLYSPLSVLAYLVFTSTIQKNYIFKTILYCNLISFLDEFIQWVHPERFFDVQDLFLNFSAILFGLSAFLMFLGKKVLFTENT